MPIVITSTRQQPDIHVVNIDNYVGGQMATRHLIEQGYRHIGHISGPIDGWEAQERKAARADVLSEAGLRVDSGAWAAGNWSSVGGRRAAQQLFDQYPQMDAIFVANDQMALSVLQLAAERGIRVPQELGVVGFDGIPESAFFWPALTTVNQNQHRLGSSAVLVDVVRGQEVATAVHAYAKGVIDEKLSENGVELEPDWALQIQ